MDQTIKLLEGNIREKISILGQSKAFLDSTLKTCSIEDKIDQLDFIKIENVCYSKGSIKKRKRQARDQEKLFENHVFDKELVSKIHKEFII